jgi:hypothetical protein
MRLAASQGKMAWRTLRSRRWHFRRLLCHSRDGASLTPWLELGTGTFVGYFAIGGF